MTDPTALPTKTVTDVATERAAEPGAGPLLLDVREADEFAAARADGAALVPMSEFAERYEELPKDRPIRVICASGNRSAAATAFLLRNGWTDVANVAGGTSAWIAAGLPTRRGTPEPGEGQL